MDKCYLYGDVMICSCPFDENSPRIYRGSNISVDAGVSVLEIGYNRVPAGMLQIMKRDVYILHYCIGGSGVFNGKSFDNQCCYLVVPEEYEKIVSDKCKPYECYWIMFKGEQVKDILQRCGISTHNGVFSFSHSAECAEILKDVIFNASPQNEYEEAFIMCSAFYKIMSIHMRDAEQKEHNTDNVAKRVAEYILSNYALPITVDDIARKYGFTRNYLYTIFKNEYKKSPKEYISDVRLKKAKQLLSDKYCDFSVCEIALAVGFTDALYFSRFFKNKTGISPSEYKKRATLDE